jgi:hypothetical protein
MGSSRRSPAAGSIPTGRVDESGPTASSRAGAAVLGRLGLEPIPSIGETGTDRAVAAQSAVRLRDRHRRPEAGEETPGIEMLTKPRSASYYGPGRAARRPRVICVRCRAPGVPPPAVCLLIPDPEGGE